MMWKIVSEADTFEHAALISKDRLDVIANLIDSQSQIMTNNTFFIKTFNTIRKVLFIDQITIT